jgi:hypothetical protein
MLIHLIKNVTCITIIVVIILLTVDAVWVMDSLEEIILMDADFLVITQGFVKEKLNVIKKLMTSLVTHFANHVTNLNAMIPVTNSKNVNVRRV